MRSEQAARFFFAAMCAWRISWLCGKLTNQEKHKVNVYIMLFAVYNKRRRASCIRKEEKDAQGRT